MYYFPLLIILFSLLLAAGGQLAQFEGSHTAPFRESACRHLTLSKDRLFSVYAILDHVDLIEEKIWIIAE